MTVFLDQLRTIRRARGVDPRYLAEVTAMEPDRVKSLENVTNLEEPWLDEAILIGRALCTQGVLPLITSGDLTDLDLGPDFATDIDLYHSGARLPLTDACRIARRLGLSDPEHLLFPTMATMRQLWSVIERCERIEGVDVCPVCLGEGGSHAPTCFGNNLLRQIDARTADIPYVPRVRSRNRKRTTGAMAHGLKHLRTKVLCKTQAQMAALVGMTANYYSMIERCAAPLHLHNAEQFAQAFRVSVADIYKWPDYATGNEITAAAAARHNAAEAKARARLSSAR